MGDPLARLQALLDGPPLLAAFGQIVALLDECRGAELEAGLARADAGLRGWPDELRCAGEQLLDEAPDGMLTRFNPNSAASRPARNAGSPTGCSDLDLRFKPIAALVRKLEFEPSHAGCDPVLIQAIARAPELGNLTILNLLSEDVDCEGAEAIANSRTLARLRELRLGDRIGDAGLCAIAQSPHLKALEKLELRGYISDDETAEILASSPLMAKLVDLQLDDDGLGPDGYEALANSELIPAEIRAYFVDPP